MFRKAIVILVTVAIVGATALTFYRTRKPVPPPELTPPPVQRAVLAPSQPVKSASTTPAPAPIFLKMTASVNPKSSAPVSPVPASPAGQPQLSVPAVRTAAPVAKPDPTVPPLIPSVPAAPSKASAPGPSDGISSEWTRVRELSWRGRHQRAIKIYKKMLQGPEAPIEMRREYARVLGWAGRYEESLSAYADAAAAAPDDPAVRAEARAKEADYRGWDLAAEAAYREWIALEPASVEARSGLAEVLSRGGRKREALEWLRPLKQELEGQPWIGVKTDKAEIAADAWRVSAFYRDREVDSGSRQTDHRERAGGLRAERAFDDAWSAYVEEEGSVHGFAFFKDVERSLTTAGGTLRSPGVFKVSGSYGRSVYGGDVSDSNVWNARVEGLFWDGWSPSFEYLRDDVIENSVTLRNGLQRDVYRAEVKARPLRQAFVTARLERWEVTDGNGRDDFWIESVWRAAEGPRQLDVFYRYQTYGYDRSTPDYFSPDDFHTHEAGFIWRRALGSAAAGDDPDNYYDFEYAACRDVHAQAAHRIAWSGRLALARGWGLEGSVYTKIYEHRDIYAENGMSVAVTHALGS